MLSFDVPQALQKIEEVLENPRLNPIERQKIILYRRALKKTPRSLSKEKISTLLQKKEETVLHTLQSEDHFYVSPPTNPKPVLQHDLERNLRMAFNGKTAKLLSSDTDIVIRADGPWFLLKHEQKVQRTDLFNFNDLLTETFLSPQQVNRFEKAYPQGLGGSTFCVLIQTMNIDTRSLGGEHNPVPPQSLPVDSLIRHDASGVYYTIGSAIPYIVEDNIIIPMGGIINSTFQFLPTHPAGLTEDRAFECMSLEVGDLMAEKTLFHEISALDFCIVHSIIKHPENPDFTSPSWLTADDKKKRQLLWIALSQDDTGLFAEQIFSEANLRDLLKNLTNQEIDSLIEDLQIFHEEAKASGDIEKERRLQKCLENYIPTLSDTLFDLGGKNLFDEDVDPAKRQTTQVEPSPLLKAMDALIVVDFARTAAAQRVPEFPRDSAEHDIHQHEAEEQLGRMIALQERIPEFVDVLAIARQQLKYYMKIQNSQKIQSILTAENLHKIELFLLAIAKLKTISSQAKHSLYVHNPARAHILSEIQEVADKIYTHTVETPTDEMLVTMTTALNNIHKQYQSFFSIRDSLVKELVSIDEPIYASARQQLHKIEQDFAEALIDCTEATTKLNILSNFLATRKSLREMIATQNSQEDSVIVIAFQQRLSVIDTQFSSSDIDPTVLTEELNNILHFLAQRKDSKKICNSGSLNEDWLSQIRDKIKQQFSKIDEQVIANPLIAIPTVTTELKQLSQNLSCFLSTRTSLQQMGASVLGGNALTSLRTQMQKIDQQISDGLPLANAMELLGPLSSQCFSFVNNKRALGDLINRAEHLNDRPEEITIIIATAKHELETIETSENLDFHSANSNLSALKQQLDAAIELQTSINKVQQVIPPQQKQDIVPIITLAKRALTLLSSKVRQQNVSNERGLARLLTNFAEDGRAATATLQKATRIFENIQQAQPPALTTSPQLQIPPPVTTLSMAPIMLPKKPSKWANRIKNFFGVFSVFGAIIAGTTILTGMSMLITGAVLTATGIGAAPGVFLMAGGLGMIALGGGALASNAFGVQHFLLSSQKTKTPSEPPSVPAPQLVVPLTASTSAVQTALTAALPLPITTTDSSFPGDTGGLEGQGGSPPTPTGFSSPAPGSVSSSPRTSLASKSGEERAAISPPESASPAVTPPPSLDLPTATSSELFKKDTGAGIGPTAEEPVGAGSTEKVCEVRSGKPPIKEGVTSSAEIVKPAATCSA
ncbi:MAG: hypothetical protein A2103_01335 [Gammaproteobacteria bacterium GWF2_41_13]|nr:MAG: hypothetical protein A2103_01335 [Gammaproteobacteria bacterium GWF2_41_13]